MSIVLLPLSAIITCLVCLVVVTWIAWKFGFPIQEPATTTDDYIPVLFVTVASICLYYTFLYLQSYVAFSEYDKANQEYKNNKKREQQQQQQQQQKPSLARLKYGKDDNFHILVANRCAQNYLEQIIPFLVSMYVYATFVNAGEAAIIGWMWLFFRSYYKFAFQNGPLLFASTLPSYLCVWYMLGYPVYIAATATATT